MDEWDVCLNNFSRREKTGNPLGGFATASQGIVISCEETSALLCKDW